MSITLSITSLYLFENFFIFLSKLIYNIVNNIVDWNNWYRFEPIATLIGGDHFWLPIISNST